MTFTVDEVGFDSKKYPNVKGINCTVKIILQAVDKDDKPVTGELSSLFDSNEISKIKNLIIKRSKEDIEGLLTTAEFKIQDEC